MEIRNITMGSKYLWSRIGAFHKWTTFHMFFYNLPPFLNFNFPQFFILSFDGKTHTNKEKENPLWLCKKIGILDWKFVKACCEELKILLSRDNFSKVCNFIRLWPQCMWNLSLYREVKYHLAYICHKCSDQFQRKQQTYEWTNFSHFGYIL